MVFFSYKTVNHKEPTIPEMPLTKEEAVSEVSAPSPEPSSGTATEETAQAPVAADRPATSQEPPAAEESGSVETENTEETAESSEIEQPTATEAPPALDIAKLSVPRTMGKADAP